MAIEVMYVTGLGVPSIAPTYIGPAVVAWVRLFEAAGFLAAGAAMIAIAARASRAAIPRPPRC